LSTNDGTVANFVESRNKLLCICVQRLDGVLNSVALCVKRIVMFIFHNLQRTQSSQPLLTAVITLYGNRSCDCW